MLHVALFEPEIAANTGNIARTCLATGATLHLIRPLGFRLRDEGLKRAGMDYWAEVDRVVHASFIDFYQRFETAFTGGRVFAYSTKANQPHSQVRYDIGDVLLFGPESRGLPDPIRDLAVGCRIPMRAGARSLNLSVSAGVVVYEAWRQLGFVGGS